MKNTFKEFTFKRRLRSLFDNRFLVQTVLWIQHTSESIGKQQKTTSLLYTST